MVVNGSGTVRAHGGWPEGGRRSGVAFVVLVLKTVGKMGWGFNKNVGPTIYLMNLIYF
jgi:hypothetical protein